MVEWIPNALLEELTKGDIKMKKEDSTKRRAFEEKKNTMIVDVIKFNKDMKRIKDSIEKDILKLETYKGSFTNQRLICNKIELLKRILVGTRYGLDRQTVRFYDIDEVPFGDKE